MFATLQPIDAFDRRGREILIPWTRVQGIALCNRFHDHPREKAVRRSTDEWRHRSLKPQREGTSDLPVPTRESQ